jgi:hypothetical protein
MLGCADCTVSGADLVQQHAASGSSSFQHGLERALVFAKKLMDLDDRFHHMYPHVSVQFDGLKALPRSYLAPAVHTRVDAFSFSEVEARS